MKGRVRIGTSGWHYRHWLGNFYPEKLPAKQMLAHYVQHFDSVGLNNSFYRLPVPSTLEQWRDATPDDFCFAAKGSRFLTHMIKLCDAGPGLQRFLDRVEVLGDKLGPIVFQLPPRWHCNLERLDEFLSLLPRRHRYSFELRDRTWLNDDVYALLQNINAAFCIYDLGGYQTPCEVTADWVYIRLHGPGGKYEGSYTDDALKKWARQIRQWRRGGKDVFVYFDNDIGGHAPVNALTLRKILKR